MQEHMHMEKKNKQKKEWSIKVHIHCTKQVDNTLKRSQAR